MRKVDNMTRCEIALHYSDEDGYMFVPGRYDEELKFHCVWEKAVKSKTLPEDWFCVSAFGGDYTAQIKAIKAVGGGVPASRLENNYS